MKFSYWQQKANPPGWVGGEIISAVSFNQSRYDKPHINKTTVTITITETTTTTTIRVSGLGGEEMIKSEVVTVIFSIISKSNAWRNRVGSVRCVKSIKNYTNLRDENVGWIGKRSGGSRVNFTILPGVPEVAAKHTANPVTLQVRSDVIFFSLLTLSHTTHSIQLYFRIVLLPLITSCQNC